MIYKNGLNINQWLDLPSIRKLLKYPMCFIGVLLSLIILLCLSLLLPFIHIKVIGLAGQRIGHLALDTDLFFRKRQLYKECTLFTPIFLVGCVANRQLLTMWKRQALIIESRFLRGLFEYTRWFWAKTKFYEQLEMNSNEFYEFNVAQRTLTLTHEEKIKGKASLKTMGIDADKDWFVCIFARDSLYLQTEFGLQKDWSYHDYRNYDIDAFKLAIDYILGLGGFVVRLGHHVAKPLNYHHPKVIDYASGLRSDFMDIYLIDSCLFYIGGHSGLSDVTTILNKPRLCINTVPINFPPVGKNNLYIPKKIINVYDRKYVPYTEYIAKVQRSRANSEHFAQFILEEGWVYEENSPQEILDATIEMIERLENRYTPTQEDQYLLDQYYKFFPEDILASKNKNPIGHKFLKQNAHLYFNENILAMSNYMTV